MSKETVTMNFPKAVHILDKDHNVIKFGPGLSEVPIELKDHYYIKANKATVYDAAEEAKKATAALEEAAKQSKIKEAEAILAKATDSGNADDIKKADAALAALKGEPKKTAKQVKIDQAIADLEAAKAGGKDLEIAAAQTALDKLTK